MRERMKRELTRAMKARDAVRVSVLRTTLAALGNAEAVHDVTAKPAGLYSTEAERRELSVIEEREVVGREHRELLAAAQEVARLGQESAAAELRAKAEVLTEFLVPRADP